MGRVWREAGAWVFGGGALIGGAWGLQYVTTKKASSEVDELIRVAAAHRERGEVAAAAHALTKCTTLLPREKRRGVAFEAARLHEEAGNLSGAEVLWKSTLDDPATTVEARRRRAVTLDRLGSLAQTQGRFEAATAYYTSALSVLAEPSDVAAAVESRATKAQAERIAPVAVELAGVMHNFATCHLERTGDVEQTQEVARRAGALCVYAARGARREECKAKVSALLRSVLDHHASSNT